jgi:hypothetical protein
LPDQNVFLLGTGMAVNIKRHIEKEQLGKEQYTQVNFRQGKIRQWANKRINQLENDKGYSR